jgi:glucose-6-phosphate 1-dehydrogenase
MDFDYDDAFPDIEIPEAYELLLLEAMEGDPTLFIRQDGVERAWEILEHLLEQPPPLRPYDAGTWGPPEADTLLEPRKWHVAGELDDAPDYPVVPPRMPANGDLG